VTIGTFSHTDAAGAVSFRLTGRVRGHKLAKRAYRLEATPTNPAGKGQPVSATFTIT
jgi:hypothetical protein